MTPLRDRVFATTWGQRLERHEFIRHVTVLLTGTAAAQAIPMLAAPLVGRLFTDSERGDYALFMALVGGLITIAALRYDLAIVLPEDDRDARGLANASLRISAVVCAAFALVLVFAGGTLGHWMKLPHLAQWAPLVGLVGFAYSCVSILNFWCNRQKNYALMSSNKLIQATTTSGTQVGLGLAGAGSFGLVISQLIGQGLGAATLAWRTRNDLAGDASPVRPLLRQYRRMPLLNGPNALVDAVRLNGIPILLAVAFGKAVTGQFNWAWTLLQVPIGIANASIGQVFYQRLAVSKPGTMFSLVSKGMLRLAAIAAVPFALIWALSPWGFPWLLGHQWVLAGDLGRVLVPWLFMNFITAPISMLFLVAKRQGAMLVFSLFYAAVPLSLLHWHTGTALQTVGRVSWAMAGLLVVMLLLSLWVARDFDQRGTSPDAEGLELSHEQIAVADPDEEP